MRTGRGSMLRLEMYRRRAEDALPTGATDPDLLPNAVAPVAALGPDAVAQVACPDSAPEWRAGAVRTGCRSGGTVARPGGLWRRHATPPGRAGGSCGAAPGFTRAPLPDWKPPPHPRRSRRNDRTASPCPRPRAVTRGEETGGKEMRRIRPHPAASPPPTCHAPFPPPDPSPHPRQIRDPRGVAWAPVIGPKRPGPIEPSSGSACRSGRSPRPWRASARPTPPGGRRTASGAGRPRAGGRREGRPPW